MDHRKGRRVAAWGFVLLMLILSPGCRGVALFHVVLPDFETAGVKGLWLWRDSGAGGYERSTVFSFQGTAFDHGIEVLQYSVRAVGGEVTQWTTPIERDVAGRGSALLRLMAGVGTVPGAWRASSWNSYGESGLSQQAVMR